MDSNGLLSLYGVGGASTGDVAASAIVAVLYFIPFIVILAQLIWSKGQKNYYIFIVTCLFSLVRTIAFIARALAEHKATKTRAEIYLILFGAATFLIIGAVSDVLRIWWVKSSGVAKTTLGDALGATRLPLVGRLTVPLVLKLLHLVGIAMAALAVRGAIKLTSSNLTETQFDDAQRHRTAAAIGFVVLTAIDVLVWLLCVLLSVHDRPMEDAAKPRRFVVASLMLGASLVLLWKVVVALVSVHKRSVVNNSGSLFGLDVLPELLCLYTLMLPTVLLGVGKDERISADPATQVAGPNSQEVAEFEGYQMQVKPGQNKYIP